MTGRLRDDPATPAALRDALTRSAKLQVVEPIDVETDFVRLGNPLDTSIGSCTGDDVAPRVENSPTNLVHGAQGIGGKGLLWGLGGGGIVAVVVGGFLLAGSNQTIVAEAQSGLGKQWREVAAIAHEDEPKVVAPMGRPEVVAQSATLKNRESIPRRVLSTPKIPASVEGQAPPPAVPLATDEESELQFQQRLQRTAASDALKALEMVEEGHVRFARGVHRADREAIAIASLLRMGRVQQARDRFTLFEQRHPASPLRAGLRQIVAPRGDEQ